MMVESGLDISRLLDWLACEIDPSIDSLSVTRLAAGHSGGAWRIDATSSGNPLSIVLKAPPIKGGVVFRADPCREAYLMGVAGQLGAPVPRILATDKGLRAVGRPCFVLEYISGRSVCDATPAGYHGDAWLRDHVPEGQRRIWESFLDALAALHAVDPGQLVPTPHTADVARGSDEAIEYWREALLDVADADTVPRQLAVIDWLHTNLPEDADVDPAICMGDARLVNAIIEGGSVRALVDFEVAYVGNPAADIGYGLFLDAMHRRYSDQALPGLPSAEYTWAYWCERTGRTVSDRNYWMAFGVMVLCITATRAMVQWGLAGPSVESANPIVAEWELMTKQAGRARRES